MNVTGDSIGSDRGPRSPGQWRAKGNDPRESRAVCVRNKMHTIVDFVLFPCFTWDRKEEGVALIPGSLPAARPFHPLRCCLRLCQPRRCPVRHAREIGGSRESDGGPKAQSGSPSGSPVRGLMRNGRIAGPPVICDDPGPPALAPVMPSAGPGEKAGHSGPDRFGDRRDRRP